MKAERRNLFFNGLRVFGGLLEFFLLLTLYLRIETLGDAAIYAATWLTFIHLCIGEYILVRYCHAQSMLQTSLDLLAYIFLLCGSIVFDSAPLWCAFFGGLFALAVVKYLALMRTATDPDLRKYAKEKVVWEMPAVLVLAVLAIVLDLLPPRSNLARLIQIAIFAGSTIFAVWMIVIRHAYREIIRKSDQADENQN